MPRDKQTRPMADEGEGARGECAGWRVWWVQQRGPTVTCIQKGRESFEANNTTRHHPPSLSLSLGCLCCPLSSTARVASCRELPAQAVLLLTTHAPLIDQLELVSSAMTDSPEQVSGLDMRSSASPDLQPPVIPCFRAHSPLVSPRLSTAGPRARRPAHTAPQGRAARSVQVSAHSRPLPRRAVYGQHHRPAHHRLGAHTRPRLPLRERRPGHRPQSAALATPCSDRALQPARSRLQLLNSLHGRCAVPLR